MKRSGEKKQLGSTPEKTLLALIRNMDPLLTNEENGNRWLESVVLSGIKITCHNSERKNPLWCKQNINNI